MERLKGTGVNDSGYSLSVPSPFAAFISLIFRWSVRRLMPSFLAAAVILPFVAASAWAINLLSVSCKSSGPVFSPNASVGETPPGNFAVAGLAHRYRQIA